MCFCVVSREYFWYRFRCSACCSEGNQYVILCNLERNVIHVMYIGSILIRDFIFKGTDKFLPHRPPSEGVGHGLCALITARKTSLSLERQQSLLHRVQVWLVVQGCLYRITPFIWLSLFSKFNTI